MYEQLKTQDPDYKLRKALILNNAILLVKNNHLEDAFKFLDQPAFDEDLERPILCERLLNTVFKNCENFEDIEKFFNKLLSKNYFKTVTTTMLSPLIKFYLDRDDIPKALEQFAWACNTHKVTPQKNVIMMKLIKNEDAKSLQHVTDLCTQVHGEINALFDLALAFLDCDRPNQAKRILETPGIRLRKGRVLAVAEKYASDGDTQKLEDLIKLLTGLFYHIEPLYMLLLNCYDQKGEWNNCLSLWTQMQEDNIQPSEQFLTRLENILVNNGQSVPFAKTNSNSKIHEEFQSYLDISNYDKAEEVLKKVPEDISDKLRAKLCKKYLLDDKVQEALVNLDYLLKKKSNAFSNDLVKTALNKLVEKKDFENIEKLGAELSRSLKKNVDYAKYLNKIYVENEKWDEFLSKRDDMITYQNIDLNKDFHCPTVLNIIESDSLKKEAFKSFAFKAFEANIYGPLHILWIHYFIKDDPEAENIWNNYLKGTQTLYSINLIATCRDIEAWDKFSFIANKIKESSIKIDEKRKSYDFMLKVLINSSDDKKFERAHEILSIATEIMPLHRFNQELRKTIEIGIKNHDLSLDEFEQKEEKNIKENLVA